jgi:hypothetical protein
MSNKPPLESPPRSQAVPSAETVAPLTPEAYRIAVTVRVCHMLRIAIERNGNVYHGGLIPNLTSVTDCLTIPFALLKEQVSKTPDLDPAKPFDPFTWQPPASTFVRPKGRI